jgi:hypothetical protein
MSESPSHRLAVASAGDLLFGTAPRPVSCGRGVRLSAGAC